MLFIEYLNYLLDNVDADIYEFDQQQYAKHSAEVKKMLHQAKVNRKMVERHAKKYCSKVYKVGDSILVKNPKSPKWKVEIKRT